VLKFQLSLDFADFFVIPKMTKEQRKS